MRVDRYLSPLATVLLLGAAAALMASLSALALISDRVTFVALTVALIGYLGLEVARLRQRQPDRWLLNPAVLCSLMTFFLAHGLSNFLFFAQATQLELLALVPEVSPAMVKVMGLALLAAAAMWLGYWSPLAAQCSRPDRVRRFGARFLPATNQLKPLTLPILLLVATAARATQIQLGVFGYSSTYDRLIELGSITQYLSMASGLGSMALALASLQFYHQAPSARNRSWLLGALSIELVFGLLSGFKSAVVMPFLVVAVCQYLSTGRLSKNWFILAFAGLMAGYAIIEPFRAARNSDADFRGTSIVSIADTMFNSTSSSVEAVAESAPLLLSFASRVNLSYIASFSVEFSDKHPTLPSGSPEFLQDILLAPLHGWIPRFIWHDKPLGNLGLWYNQVVIGNTHFSSTAMGPMIYLYFAGGAVAVFLGFFFVGMVQRCLFFLLQPRTSSAGSVIFLAMLMPLANMDSAFNAFIITLLRDLPLVILLQFLLFEDMPRRRNAGHATPATAAPDLGPDLFAGNPMPPTARPGS